jgi:hypothetical protein
MMGCFQKSDCPKTRGQNPDCCNNVCIDLNVDAKNCGTCGMACPDPMNGVAACVGGGCIIGSCSAGYADCDSRPDNGCEVKTDTDVKNCGACKTVCMAGQASAPMCVAGKCNSTCGAGFADCDNNPANGCEVNTSNDPNNCGMCGTMCGNLPNASGAACIMGACKVTGCTGWFQDCNGMGADGCEANTVMDTSNCGGCGMMCTVIHGTPACSNGTCAVKTCDSGWGDCDGNAANGCEKDVTKDARNCGKCGYACAGNQSVQSCSTGKCHIDSCSPGFNDCDNLPETGCESNSNTDVLNCSACGMACPVPANATVACNLGKCAVTGCTPGYADCNGDLQMMGGDGCETDITTVLNCGKCGNACNTPNAVPACKGGMCAIGMCNMGFADCDQNVGNGCEINLGIDPKNCGKCNQTCTYANATPTCQAGGCVMGACNQNFADCNKSDKDGCEVNTFTDIMNCGACGTVCDPNKFNACLNGMCGNSIHNTVAWMPQSTYNGGCSNGAQANYPWLDLGAMNWKSCMMEASKRGAMVQEPVSGNWSYSGWYGHRKGASAMVGDLYGWDWTSFYLYNINSNYRCLLMRDPNSGNDRSSQALANIVNYDGNIWHYQDFGSVSWGACQTYAGKSGGSIITPFTVGLVGDNYFYGIKHTCCEFAFSQCNGQCMSYNESCDLNGGNHPCMIGYMDQ